MTENKFTRMTTVNKEELSNIRIVMEASISYVNDRNKTEKISHKQMLKSTLIVQHTEKNGRRKSVCESDEMERDVVKKMVTMMTRQKNMNDILQ